MKPARAVMRMLGRDTSPLVIAEMSGNHNLSLDRALQIVDAAARAGAHAIKLQTYTADTMTLDLQTGDFLISDPSNPFAGQSLYTLYQKASTPWEWHEPIFQRARELGLIAFSSPFDETAVEFLESLGAPCYKVASFEIVDLPLIRRIAATGKPMFISTGMASIAEIDDAVRAAREAGCAEIVLLKCTSNYPAAPEDAHLATIPHMREAFGCDVGLSDHTLGIGVAVAAVALGATVIEKHLTLARADGGVDATFSLEPHELAALVVEAEAAWHSIGCVAYGPTDTETGAAARRRSLYLSADIDVGDVLTRDNVRAIRPGKGLPPKHLNTLLGMTATRAAQRGTPVTWDLVK